MEKKPNKNVMDPYFNNFVSSLTTSINGNDLDQNTKSNLVSFIYLLLNKRFQQMIKEIRVSMDIPKNGFESMQSYYEWRNVFFRLVNDYQRAKKIPLKQNKVITFIEKEVLKASGGRMSISGIFQYPEHSFVLALTKRLRISSRNSELWHIFLYHLIFTFSPKELIKDLHNRHDRLITIHNHDLSIQLSAESTINSLRKIIDDNRKSILEAIKEIKKKSANTKAETFDIKRDYFIYTTYISHKSSRKHGENIYQNTRKELEVSEKAEEMLSNKQFEKIDNLDWASMRKIVSRMNERIDGSFIDKADGIGNFLESLRTTKPTPYPEYVAGRLITH